MVFAAVCLVLREILKIKLADTGQRFSAKKDGKVSTMQKLENLSVGGRKPLKTVTGLYKRLKMQKAEKLVAMAIIVMTLLLVNLYISVTSAPILEQFQLKVQCHRVLHLFLHI
jgi:hypothetical protein